MVGVIRGDGRFAPGADAAKPPAVVVHPVARFDLRNGTWMECPESVDLSVGPPWMPRSRPHQWFEETDACRFRCRCGEDYRVLRSRLRAAFEEARLRRRAEIVLPFDLPQRPRA